MLSKLLKAFPAVFSLRPSSDYSEFLVHKTAGEIMRDNWVGVGRRMDGAIKKVGRDVEKQKNK